MTNDILNTQGVRVTKSDVMFGWHTYCELCNGRGTLHPRSHWVYLYTYEYNERHDTHCQTQTGSSEFRIRRRNFSCPGVIECSSHFKFKVRTIIQTIKELLSPLYCLFCSETENFSKSLSKLTYASAIEIHTKNYSFLYTLIIITNQW